MLNSPYRCFSPSSWTFYKHIHSFHSILYSFYCCSLSCFLGCKSCRFSRSCKTFCSSTTLRYNISLIISYGNYSVIEGCSYVSIPLCYKNFFLFFLFYFLPLIPRILMCQFFLISHCSFLTFFSSCISFCSLSISW